jgi:hypothetical protein
MSFDDFIDVAKVTLAEQIEQANATADRVINADNQNKLIHEVRETSDDEQIAKFRNWFDQANARIEAEIKKIDQYIVDQGMVSTATVDVPTETENYKALATNIKAMQSTVKTLLGYDDEKFKALELPELKSLPGVRKSGGSSSSGGGTGTRRPRLSAISVDYGNGDVADIYETKPGENGQPDRHSATLTLLGKTLSDKFKTKVEVSSLQSELFAAANTDDLSTLEGKPVTFPVTIKGDDNTSTIVTVTATPSVK